MITAVKNSKSLSVFTSPLRTHRATIVPTSIVIFEFDSDLVLDTEIKATSVIMK